MNNTNPDIDAYIANQADFARPILTHLRAMVHATCPEIIENIKWGMPSFEYQGLLCGMAAFKAHATFGFWKHAMVVGDDAKARDAMGSFGRLTSVAQLPSKKVFAVLMIKAMKLNDEGVKNPRAKHKATRVIPMPTYFKSALAKNKPAQKNYDAFPPSQKREYLEWITDAKTRATREKSVATSIAWLSEGKRRNWKYEKC